MSLSIEQAAAQQERYVARPEIRDALGGTALIAFVGSTASGKNFLMHASGLHTVGTETSRAKRESDNPLKYRYSTVEDMLTDIEERETVQYGVAPPNIYASKLKDYDLDQPNVSDIWFDAVHPLNNKGFSVVRSVSVLTRKNQYKARLEMRLEGMRLDEAMRRLDHDRYSLRWTRAQQASHNPNHLVIINDADSVDEKGRTIHSVQNNAERIYDFAHGNPVDNPDENLVNILLNETTALLQTKYGIPQIPLSIENN